MLAVFVDFTHVHAAPNHPVSSATSKGPAVAGAADGARQTGASCPVCLWLRSGPRLTSQISVEGARSAVQPESALMTDNAPASPIPHPTAFRGPPRPAFG